MPVRGTGIPSPVDRYNLNRFEENPVNLARLMLCCLLLAATFAAGQRQPLPAQCTFNSDCADPLVCAGGYCRSQCRDDRDCYNGWVCREPNVRYKTPQSAAPAIRGGNYNRCVPPDSSNDVEVDGLNLRLLPIRIPGMPQSGSSQNVAPAQPAAQPPAQPPASGGVIAPPSSQVLNINGRKFKRGADGKLARMNGNERDWTSVPTPSNLTADPAGLQVAGNIHIFARLQDNAVWATQCSLDNLQCDKWVSLGGVVTSGPSVTLLAQGIRVTAQGMDGRRWQTDYNYATRSASGWIPAP